MSQKVNEICKCGHNEEYHHVNASGIIYCDYCTCKDLVIVAYHDDLRNLVVVYTEKYPGSDELNAIEAEYNGKSYQIITPRQEGNETYQYAIFMKKNKRVSVKPIVSKRANEHLF